MHSNNSEVPKIWLPKLPGRIGRFIVGGFTIMVPFEIYNHFSPLFWLLIAALTLYLIRYSLNVGFKRNWKNLPRFGFLLVILIGTILDQIYFGTFFGAFTRSVLLVGIFWTWIHIGIAFLLSGLIGSPGCELVAYHVIYAKLRKRPYKDQPCPVPWSPIHFLDEFEKKIYLK